MTANELADWVIDARQRTFDIVADLTDEQIMSPYLSIVNPLIMGNWACRMVPRKVGAARYMQSKADSR